MLDKIKAFGEAAKNLVLWVFAPLLFVLGYLWYLSSKNSELQEKLRAKDGEEKLEEIKYEKKEVDSKANDAVDHFEQLRSRHQSERERELRGSNSGGGKSNPSPEDPDRSA